MLEMSSFGAVGKLAFCEQNCIWPSCIPPFVTFIAVLMSCLETAAQAVHLKECLLDSAQGVVHNKSFFNVLNSLSHYVRIFYAFSLVIIIYDFFFSLTVKIWLNSLFNYVRSNIIHWLKFDDTIYMLCVSL